MLRARRSAFGRSKHACFHLCWQITWWHLGQEDSPAEGRPLAGMAVTLSPFRTQRLYLSSKIDGVDFSLWVFCPFFFFLVSVF